MGTVVPDRFTPVFLESVFRETKKRKNISTLKQLPKNYLVFWRNQKNYTNDLQRNKEGFTRIVSEPEEPNIPKKFLISSYISIITY